MSSKRRCGHGIVKAGRVKRKAVLKMVTVMQRKEPALPTEFLVTGRTGRRNAMPDILDPPHAGMTLADLPERLQQLTTTDTEESSPSASTSGESGAKMDQQAETSPQQKNANS